MADSPGDDDFEDYDKPGAERSRRRRGEDDLDSDLESDLLEEDWLTAKKDPSEVSDEELNDDLLQSDEEDENIGQGFSLNATLCEFDQQVNPIDYPEKGDIEGGYQQEGGEYMDEYSLLNDMEIPDGQMEYSGEQAGGDGVLDIQINEPLDDEFQADDYSPSYGGGEKQEEQAAQQEAPEEEEVSQLADTEAENEAEPKEEVKEEEDEDEEEDDDGESGRLRFKTERKDVTSGVVRLADAGTKRRNIPETLELSEEAKAGLMEFEEKERQRKQGRFGGRGGDRGGFRGRGLRGRFPGFGMGDFGGGRGRMNDLRLPMVPLHMGMQRPGDFQQQHVPGNFGQPPQRPPHHMEPWRNQPPPTPQDREPFFIGEPGRFPGQQLLMFDHQNPGLLMNSNNHQLSSQGHMAFNQPSPGGFNQPGQGPGGQLGMFQREPPRPNLPPQGHPQSHQGMASLTGHSGPTNTRLFMGHRQPGFPQQQGTPGPFPSQQLQFGMQVRMRGLMQHGLLHSQLQHHDLPLSHQQQHQQHHRQDVSQRPIQHHSHPHPNEQRQGPMMHRGGQGQPPFHQQQHGSPRQMHPSGPRPQNFQQRNAPIRPRMSPPAPKLIPQRNSNLRELPVAPGNQNANNVRPSSAPNASNVRPVARAMQGGARPGLNPRPVPGGGRGRAQPAAANKAAAQLPGPLERTVVRRDSTSTLPNTAVQDPDEDEETRQYRLKIEEQKRLREEILKRKEMRRQMQASVRKKELLERINGQGDPQQQQLQHHQQQMQRPFPPKLQQPQQGTSAFPPSGTPQTPTALRQNVKTHLTKGEQAPAPGWQGVQQGSNTGPGCPGPNPHQQAQWQQQHGQQRRNVTQLNPIRPGGAPPMGNMPIQGVPMAGLGSGQAQSLGPKSGVKRTVMQRANSGDGAGPQVPQKVRVVKLLGGGGDVSGASAPIQQQAARPVPQLRQGPVRKVTLASPPGGLPIQGLVTQGGRGGMGNRVVVPGCGRASGAAGGTGQLGRGRLIPTRQSQRGAEDSQACTVSIDGLSTSTTDAQLRNLLNSIGPIQMFKMLPQQRKAIAKFHNPQHALSFQVSFNRHMIDLSHIDVSLIDV
ncbi:RNA-binding protein 33 isoform X7 [Oncorhynchus kisutch]|uniref:RNA-binding protein 33 isoform X7 n=1 Tax=Oncorhynchus kisutch TaxID=8019 RepID=UPI00099F5D07|nr:RNA-binding protein 33 isoform X7 [Oncorhynchus kisutch]